ncbi:Brp/Blh family beta-carotene 15,15'-dioxygenase [Sphingomonas sanguinis]|nr:Brp/Blh family beta-carotene 15,15'-dioxygenase [Sphingomonas sp. LC-1]
MNRVIALLVMGGALVTPAPLPVHLAFAILGIGVVGMVHGAGDLAVVAKPRRPAFLAAYGLISLATLFWWIREPAVALPAFLVASAIHFGVEDAPCGPLAERIARGVTLVLGPAALHHIGYAELLRLAGGSSSSLTELTPLAAITGGLSGATLLLLACHRRDALLAMGVGALLLFPPLVGFTIGFLVLHALPQTRDRRDRLGCSSTTAYIKTVAPIFVAAIILAGLVAGLLLHFDPSGVRGLFAGIAALAVPHLLVTPWFEERMDSPELRHRIKSYPYCASSNSLL